MSAEILVLRKEGITLEFPACDKPIAELLLLQLNVELGKDELKIISAVVSPEQVNNSVIPEIIGTGKAFNCKVADCPIQPSKEDVKIMESKIAELVLLKKSKAGIG